LVPEEQLVIELADFIQNLLGLSVSLQGLAGLIELLGRFEQERLELPLGKGTVEVKERAMPGAAGMAVAIGLATLEQTLEQGSVKQMGWEIKGTEEMGFALA